MSIVDYVKTTFEKCDNIYQGLERLGVVCGRSWTNEAGVMVSTWSVPEFLCVEVPTGSMKSLG